MELTPFVCVKPNTSEKKGGRLWKIKKLKICSLFSVVALF